MKNKIDIFLGEMLKTSTQFMVIDYGDRRVTDLLSFHGKLGSVSIKNRINDLIEIEYIPNRGKVKSLVCKIDDISEFLKSYAKAIEDDKNSSLFKNEILTKEKFLKFKDIAFKLLKKEKTPSYVLDSSYSTMFGFKIDGQDWSLQIYKKFKPNGIDHVKIDMMSKRIDDEKIFVLNFCVSAQEINEFEILNEMFVKNKMVETDVNAWLEEISKTAESDLKKVILKTRMEVDLKINDEGQSMKNKI